MGDVYTVFCKTKLLYNKLRLLNSHMFTNINILGNDHVYNYIVEYKKDSQEYIERGFNYIQNYDTISFWKGSAGLVKNHNRWEEAQGILSNEYIPTTYKKSIINLYFPDFSVDTYENGVKYALSVNVWIGGKCVVLGSVILDRCDALACDKIKKFSDTNYYEKFALDIIDPYDMLYSDTWKDFRHFICGEPLIDGKSINSTESVLYISLHPVYYIGDDYVKLDGYTGGQNSINLTKDPTDFLGVKLYSNTDNKLMYNETPAIVFEPYFNKEYSGDLSNYLLETYRIKDYNLVYNLIIGNEDNIYAILNSEETKDVIYKFTKQDILTSSKNFQNGTGWTPGIFITGSMDILDSDGNSVLYILSNKIPFNEELFRFYVGSEDLITNGYVINNVNIESVDMDLLNINVVNKIVNNVIQMDNRTDVKSNLTQPVFFRSVDAMGITIHPEVTETISINLDIYKSKVDTFVLQLEGVTFPEIGRVNSGVLFKVVGKKLPKSTKDGIYFILNEDMELVTSGKYNYI